MGPVRQNPSQRTVRSVHTCALHCVQLLRTILHRTNPIIFPFTFQTIIIAPMMFIWGKGALLFMNNEHMWSRMTTDGFHFLLQVTMGMRFPKGMGIPWECSTNPGNRGNLNGNYGEHIKWEWPQFQWESIAIDNANVRESRFRIRLAYTSTLPAAWLRSEEPVSAKHSSLQKSATDTDLILRTSGWMVG